MNNMSIKAACWYIIDTVDNNIFHKDIERDRRII